ncbi:hypothetical protein M8J77_020115 [Diaphorina citri]|nr:hypothetical protein M8J77_020115 [Diaphorina citri]
MLTEPILSHESEYPFPVVPTVLKLAGQGTSDSADSRARLVLYEPAHSGSITHLVDTIDRHHIGPTLEKIIWSYSLLKRPPPSKENETGEPNLAKTKLRKPYYWIISPFGVLQCYIKVSRFLI